MGRHLTGSTAFFAAAVDPRFSYCLHVPVDDPERAGGLPLVVVVPGADRTAETLRDAFAAFARDRRCVVLAPLFPMRAADPASLQNFSAIEYGGTRFDEVLLGMVDEVGDLLRLDAQRFALFGFSAGAQFAHRFLYLHPERLSAVSVASAGRITRPDPARPWPAGLGQAADRFGTVPSPDALGRVGVQLVVGALDTVISPTAGAAAPGELRTRVENMQILHADLAGLGSEVELVVVPGAGHEVGPLLGAVQAFLGRHLPAPGRG